MTKEQLIVRLEHLLKLFESYAEEATIRGEDYHAGYEDSTADIYTHLYDLIEEAKVDDTGT